MRSTLSGLAGSGTVMVNIALLFYIIGYVSPYWLIKPSSPEAYSGVWKTCAEEEVPNDSGNGTIVKFVCYDTQEYLNDDWNSTWIPGLRAMTSLGLITILNAAIVANVYACSKKMMFNNGMAFVSMCSCFAAWFFSLTGVLIHGIRRFDDVFRGYHLSWAFALCCTGSCCVIVSGGLFFGEVAKLNSEAIQRKLGRPGGIFFSKQIRQIDPDDAKPSDTDWKTTE